jgi:uncharacterized protein with ParB-like and HNH nuclease domain/predicted transport protein
MKADETNFLKFLNKPMQLEIPIYQRAYSWNLEECEQLWDDIFKTGSNSIMSGHFIGSIVYIEKGLYQVTELPKLLVIDGQQRLTTVSLLVSALCNYIRDNNVDTEIEHERLRSYYLLNTHESNEKKYKLLLTRRDKESYTNLLENIDTTSNEDIDRIRQNYNFFLGKLNTDVIHQVYKGVSKLIIIDVSLDREKDNPQLIFESLNSTGLELTQADLIRNYILMGLEKEKQEELYNNFWFPIERNFGHSENTKLFDNFVRDYLTIKLGRIPTFKYIYAEFKKFSKRFDVIDELVKDIYEYAQYFGNIALEKEPDKEIREVFEDINQLRVDVSYPFIIQVYKDYKDNVIEKSDLIKILRLIESYVFRRAICEVPTNSLNKTFATLYKKINKKDYVESVEANMVLQDSYRRMPDDSEFTKFLITKDIYNFRNRNYLLSKLENYRRNEKVDVESCTIEHIMPQNPNLSESWKNDLGEDWKDIQKKYLHTIGNLTLTGYNSEYQDKPFLKKRDFKDKDNMPIGFKDSPYRLNRVLATLDVWNEEEINKRAKDIANTALSIWKYPQLSEDILDKYREEETVVKNNIYTIDDYEFLKEGSSMRSLFEELRKRILNIDASIREEPKKLYIAYKSVTNFVDIIPQKSSLRLSLNIPFEEINDPEDKCRDVTGLGRWGNGDTSTSISNYDDLDYSLKLIKQAFDYIVENGR